MDPFALALRGTLLSMFFIPVAAGAALDVAVEATPDPVEPGEALRVAITVTNPGGAPSGSITLELPYPANLASLSDSLISDGGGCPGSTCDASETVFWNLGTLGPGEGITVDLPPSVLGGGSAPVDGTVITFAAEVFESAVSAAVAQHSVSVLAARVFDLAIDEDRDPVAAGDILLYEITYGNRSAETTTGTGMTFPLPTGTTFAGASGGGMLVGGSVLWDLGTLSGHEGGRRTVTVTVGGGLAEGTILQPANASITGQGDFLTHTSRATSATRIENGTRLLLGVVANPDPARPGEALRAAITVSNPNPASFVNNIVLRLRYPVGLASLDDSLVSDAGGCLGSTCDTGETLTWSLGNLPPGRGLTVTLPPAIAAPPGGSLVTLPVSLDADGQSRSLERQTLIVRAERLLDLAVEAERSPIGAGGRLTYAVVYGNRSAETTTGTTLRVPLPAGTSFVSASDGGTFAGGVVTWSLGTLVGHEGGQRQMTVAVGSGLSEGTQLAVDPATITGQGSFLTHATRARSNARVENATRLDVAVTVDRDPIVPAEGLGVRVTITNRSSIDFANNVALRLRYPTGLASLDDSLIIDGGCVGSTCDPNEVAVFDLGNLPPGGGAVVELPPTVASGAPGGSIVTVPVEVNATDRSRTLAAHPVLVRTARVFDLAVDLDADPIPVGGAVVYDLSFGNRGTETTSGTVLSLPIPVGADFLGASDGGSVAGGVVQWNLGNLNAGETGRRSAAFDLPPATTAGSLLRVSGAEIRGTGMFGDHEARARDARRVEDVDLTLIVDATPEPVLPNGTLDTMLQVSNPSPAFIFGVVLQLRYPEPLFSLSDSLVSDGGFCLGSTCDEGELVTWNLGDLAPGAVVDVSLPPAVRNTTSNGSLVRYWAHVFATNFGKAVFTRSIPVGNQFDDAGPIEITTIFSDGFESGDTSVWSQTVP